jgi:hypothetical protein
LLSFGKLKSIDEKLIVELIRIAEISQFSEMIEKP